MDKPSKAFTLIELLVVISIIGLLSSVVMASLNSAREKGRIGGARYFATQTYHVAGEQAVGIWNFDECSNSTAVDQSGFGHTMSLVNGPVSSTDTPTGQGCSLSLSGNDTVVSVSGAPAIVQTGALTISAWVKFAPGVLSYNTITIRGNTYNIVPWAHFYFDASASKLTLWNANGNSAANSNTILIKDNKWHHVAVSASAGQKIFFYLDGVDVTPASGNNTYSETVSTLAAYPFEIGARTHTSGIIHELVGMIDDVSLYLRFLNASEIGRLYAESSRNYELANIMN